MSNSPQPENTTDGPAYEGRLLPRPDDDVVDQGAGFDVSTLISRRWVLSAVGIGAGTLALAACGSASDTATTTGSTTGSTSGSTSTSATTASGEIPQETNGPYPADGTNGVNILEDSGIVRSDITTSIDGSATADGVPLSFTYTITDMANNNAPFEGVALYMWQADAEGRYSMYSSGVEDVTYLRGVQVADANGEVTFTTIVPACYDGRWPHLHFEIYPDLASATNAENAIATSQVAFPEDMVSAVYALDSYPSSAANLAKVTLDTDMVFSDGYDLEMGTFTGDPTSGYVGSLAVAVDTTTAATTGGGGGMPGGTPPSGGMPGGTPPTGN